MHRLQIQGELSIRLSEVVHCSTGTRTSANAAGHGRVRPRPYRSFCGPIEIVATRRARRRCQRPKKAVNTSPK